MKKKKKGRTKNRKAIRNKLSKVGSQNETASEKNGRKENGLKKQ